MNNIDIEKLNSYINSQNMYESIYCFDQIDSTNAYAKRNLAQLQSGSVIIAKSQTNGKGRLGREWMSVHGLGIWMSIVLKTDLKVNEISKLSSVVGIAVKKGIQGVIGNQVFIKWPNDIIINKKKVCGILIESIICGGKVEALIVGIGINVKQGEDYFTGLPHASSLQLECGQNVNFEDVIVNVLKCLENGYKKFLSIKKIDLDELTSASILINKEVEVIENNKKSFGTVKGFLEDGSIIIKNNNGEEMIFGSFNVSIRGLNSYVD